MQTSGLAGAGEHRLTQFDVLGVPITSGEPADARSAIEAACDSAERPITLAYANAHTLNVASTEPSYRDVLRRCDAVLNDGVGVSIAARLQGVQVPANLNGSDFTLELLDMAAQRDWSVYLLGARPGVAESAGRRLEADVPGLRIAGARDGYFDPADSPEVAEDVRRSGADVLLAAMGNPQQERWLDEHAEASGVRLATGVGAFLDFAAGEVPRAPAWINRIGLEWLYRLLQEPGRLWRRYVVGNPLFLWRVIVADVVRSR